MPIPVEPPPMTAMCGTDAISSPLEVNTLYFIGKPESTVNSVGRLLSSYFVTELVTGPTAAFLSRLEMRG
jgi:hypothetical protein